MRIIHIIPTLGCGGAETLVGNIAIGQVNGGDVVKILILEPLHHTFANYSLKEELEKKVSIEQINSKITFSFFRNKPEMNTDQLDAVIEGFKPDIIHSHLFQAEFISRYKIYPGVKYFSHCHNNMSQFNFWLKKPIKRKLSDFFEKRWLVKKYGECMNTFVAISKNTAEYYRKVLPGKMGERIFLLPNAINTSNYRKKEVNDDGVAKLINVGNLLENKGQSFLIDVVHELSKKGINVQLDILGFGYLKNNLERKIENLGLQKHVFLRGSVSNVNEYLSSADIYIHGAFKEAFGLVLVEAMASGLPVITTDGGGNKELIIEDYNGYLIQDRKLEVYTDKLIGLISDVAKRREMGLNARKFSLSFDIVPYIEKLNEMYGKA